MDWIKLDEASKMLGYKISSFRVLWKQFCDTNKIRYTKLNPKAIRINKEDIEKVLSGEKL